MSSKASGAALARPTPAWLTARMIAHSPFWYGAYALGWILFHLWPVVPGLLARAFFDTLQGQAPAGWNLSTVAALVLAAGTARAAVVFGANGSGVPFRFRVRSLLQRNLLARILDRPAAGSPGEAISTLRDDTEAAGEMADWLFDVVAGLLFAGVGLAVLLSVNARITLLAFLPVAVVIALSQLVRVRLVRAREQSRAATARVTGAIGDIFGAVQAIQVAGAADRVVRHLARLNAGRRQAMLRDRLQGLWLDAVFEQTAHLGTGLVLLAAAGQMRAGSFSVGDFALFAAYLMQVADYTSFLGYLINSYRQAAVSFRRLLALMQGAPASQLAEHHPLQLRTAPPAQAAAFSAAPDRLERLEVVGLTCRHPGGQGIEDVSFSLERGSLTVITGRMGAGKSTLLRALLGLLAPKAGEVRWNGRKVEDPARFLVPPRAAYTPQVPTLLSGSLRENILLGMAAGPERVAAAVRDAALDRDLAGFPDGPETVVGARGVRLSGGQIQRAAVARMLVREPELLLVDDPSGALDAETEQLLWQRLHERKATWLVVSHRPAALAAADQILILAEGRITACGRLPELLSSSPEMRELWRGGHDPVRRSP